MVVALAVLGALFLGLTALVWHTQGPVGLDRALLRLTAASATRLLIEGRPLAPPPERTVPLGSSEGVLVMAAVAALVAVAWGDWTGALLALLAPGLTGALTEYLLKPLVTPVSLGTGRGFPSGHAGGVASVAVVAVLLMARRWGRVPALVLAPLAVLPVGLVGEALVRLAYHYPTDVIGGILLASVVALGLHAVLPSSERFSPDGGGGPRSPASDPSVLSAPGHPPASRPGRHRR